jgi:energy-coupling factor transporter ATP-binding protein EcfA2
MVEKQWTVSGPIHERDKVSYYYMDPAAQEENIRCLNGVKKGQFVMLVGARASGKTTRLYRLMSQLEGDNYLCL